MKNKSIAKSTFFIGVLLMIWGTWSSAATISGTVYQSNGTTSIGMGIKVIATNIACSGNVVGEAYTAPDGKYMITLPAGIYYLKTDNQNTLNYVNEWWASPASQIDCIKTQPIVITSEDAIVSGKNFQLDKGATISGTIYPANSTIPLTGFQFGVNVFKGAPCGTLQLIATAQSDTSNGKYTVLGVPAGTYYVQTDNLMRAYYRNEWWATTASQLDCAKAGAVAVAAGGVVIGKNFQLDKASSISGKIYQSDGSTELTGKNIKISVIQGDPCGDPLKVIDAAWVNPSDATYFIPSLPAGTYTLKASNEENYLDEWWAPSNSQQACQDALSVTTTLDETTMDTNFQLDQGVVITGYIRNPNGSGIDGVVMSGLPSKITTNVTGFYHAVVPVGWSGKITPMKSGYAFTPQDLEYTGVTSDQVGQDYLRTIDCSTATLLTPNTPTPYSDTTVGANAIAITYTDWTDAETGPEKIYKLYTPLAGVINAELSGLPVGVDLDVFILDACDSGATKAADDLSASYYAPAPGFYYVVVDGKNGKSGAFKLSVDAPTGYDNWSPWVDGKRAAAGTVSMDVLNSGLYQAVKGTDTFVWTRYTNDGYSWYSWKNTGGLNGGTVLPKVGGTTVAMKVFGSDLFQAIRELTTNRVVTRAYTSATSPWMPDMTGYKAASDVTMEVMDTRLYQAVKATATTMPPAPANAVLTRYMESGSDWTTWHVDSSRLSAGEITMQMYNNQLYQAMRENITNKVLTRIYAPTLGAWEFDSATTAAKAAGNVSMTVFNDSLYQAIRENGTNKVLTRVYQTATSPWVKDLSTTTTLNDVTMKTIVVKGQPRLYQAINSAGKVATRYTFDGENWTSWVAEGITNAPVTLIVFNPHGSGDRLYQAAKDATNKIWTRYMTGVPVMMTQPVTIRKNGSGTGTITADTQVCGPDCTELQIPYTEGAQMKLAVTPAAGSVFVRWEKTDGAMLATIANVLPGETVIAVFNKKP